MAKLFKHVGSTLRAKTHDVDETAMRERGATGVFRNAAFQELEEEAVPSTSEKPSTPNGFRRNSIFATNQKESLALEAASPRSAMRVSADQGALMWASPPMTPTPALAPAPPANKRGKEGSPPPSRGSQRPPTVKRLKNATQVEQLASPEVIEREELEERQNSDAGSGVLVAPHWTRNLCSNYLTSNSNSVCAWEADVKRLLAAGRHEEAVHWVAPSDGMIHCTVRRVKNFLGGTAAFQLFLDSGDVFILAARKRKKSKISNFVLSTSQDDLGKDSSSCIAKLRANFVGTEYCLAARTGSISGGSADGDQTPTSSGRLPPTLEPFAREVLAVHYKQTVLTAKGGPRVMLVATPLPDSNWAPTAPDGSDGLPACLEAARRRELSPRLERQLCMLATRPPEWDENLKSYTLDFHGRVRASSVKNFQLVHWDHNNDRKGSDLVLQFGKIREGCEDFALDFTYPLTLQKAFAIALASTDSKLCYAI